MQYIDEENHIPYNLIEAHKKGKVVFFCGAGISKPANLPLFNELATNIIGKAKLNFPKDHIPNPELDLGYFESQINNGRNIILNRLSDELDIKNKPNAQKFFHNSLLKLSRANNNRTQLVTTNFDRIFEQCNVPINKKPQSLIAPRLPVPKPNRWDGIVYLHGLLPKDKTDLINSDNFVITSGDFGQAYLNERWASRFITELFRNYVVCFVGYSLNDAVMRYLTDSFAKEERKGIKLPERYIFVSLEYKNNKQYKKDKEKKEYELSQKKITPIFYDLKKDDKLFKGHFELRKKLNKWLSIYNEEIDTNKELISKVINFVNSHEKIPPSTIEFFIKALNNLSGAKYFAEFFPRPSFDLLDILDKTEITFEDLPSHDHEWSPSLKLNNFLFCSILFKKANFEDSSFLSPFDETDYSNRENKLIIDYLIKWIVRYLDDPKLILWVVKQKKPLSRKFKQLIEFELNKAERKPGLGLYNQNLSDPIITNEIRNIWEMFLLNSIGNNINNVTPYSKEFIETIFKRTGLTTLVKFELKNLLKPILQLECKIQKNDANKIYSLNNLFHFKIDTGFARLVSFPDKEFILKMPFLNNTLINDRIFYFNLFSNAIVDMLDLVNLLFNDISGFILIDKINNISLFFKYNNWVTLVQCLFELWGLIADQDKKIALQLLENWIESKHEMFHRMVFLCLIKNSQSFDNADFIFAILTRNNYHLLLVDYKQKYYLLRKFADKFTEFQILTLIFHLLVFVDDINIFESETNNE